MDIKTQNELIKDIEAILKNGAVAISDLNKQLRGINCTCIDRMWAVPTKLCDFESLLEEYGFVIIDRVGKNGRPLGKSVITDNQYQEALELRYDIGSYQYQMDNAGGTLKDHYKVKIESINYRLKALGFAA